MTTGTCFTLFEYLHGYADFIGIGKVTPVLDEFFWGVNIYIYTHKHRLLVFDKKAICVLQICVSICRVRWFHA